MKKYMYTGCGGFAGAVSRYGIAQITIPYSNELLPSNLFLINGIGAFLMVFIMELAFESQNKSEELRVGVTAGFLGGFTTFSTLCKETALLLQSGTVFSASVYMLFSAVLGFAAGLLGGLSAKKINSIKRKKERGR